MLSTVPTLAERHAFRRAGLGRRPDFASIGVLALGIVLVEPDHELKDLRDTVTYPDALATALIQNLWEAELLVTVAGKATRRGDAAYVALCLSRAPLRCAHALHGHERRWLVNAKGAVAAAGRLPGAPTGFADRANALLGGVGTTPADLAAAVDTAREIVAEVRGRTAG